MGDGTREGNKGAGQDQLRSECGENLFFIYDSPRRRSMVTDIYSGRCPAQIWGDRRAGDSEQYNL